MTHLSNFHVCDCGDVDGLRFQVWAEATDSDDTSRVASAYVCSTDTDENAHMIASALEAVQRLERTFDPELLKQLSGAPHQARKAACRIVTHSDALLKDATI